MICAATSLLLVILTTLLASGQTLRPPSRPSCSRRYPIDGLGAWSLFAAATAAKNALPRIPASSACRVLGFLTSAKKVTPWRYSLALVARREFLMGGSMPRRSWTTSEVRFLKKWAGRISANEICEALGRSKASVQSKVCELRKGGEGVSLRHYESVLVWCPNCATWRTKVFKGTGLCLVCRLRSRVDRCRRRCEEALLSFLRSARGILSKQFKRGSSILRNPR